MKNKEVLSGILGGSFFAATYLAVGVPLVPSLVVGAFAFLGSELIMSKTKIIAFDKVNEKNVEEVLNDARSKNKYILEMIEKVEDEDVKTDLKEINVTTAKIINTVSKNKKKIKQSEKFFTYYLPMTVGIINKYDEIENQKLSSTESKEFVKSTNKMIGEINKAYKKILDNMYRKDIVDMDAEMKVFNSLLKADGFNDAEFPLKKEEKEDE